MSKKKQVSGKKKNSSGWDARRTIVAVLALFLAALMLLPMLTMVVGNAGAVNQTEIDALKKDQAEARRRQQELKDQLKDVKDDQAKAANKRRIVTEQLEVLNQELSSINSQITYYDNEITQKEAERQETMAKEEEQYQLFCQRVRSMEEDGNVSYWSILFKAESFADMLDRLTVVHDIMDYDNAVMNQLAATRAEIEQLQTELKSAKTEEEAAKAELEARKAEQQVKVNEAQAILNDINADVAEVNRQLEEESAAVKEIQNEITKKQREMEAERRKNNITIDAESDYLWPLPGYYRITSRFGYRIHPITHRAHSHSGTDIPAPRGTPILAAKSGQVVTSAKHWSYGNYVVIDHGNGNSTLYAHMNSRAVKVGQMVKQGQVIGYVGTTGSSTGNHLHLEVRENYKRIDPETKYTNIKLIPPW